MRKLNRSGKTPQNPADSAVREARKEWTRAIGRSDTHSRKCRPCNKRRHPLALAKQTCTLATIDPYKPCREATRLWDLETAARKTYQALGGALGVVLLAPWILFGLEAALAVTA